VNSRSIKIRLVGWYAGLLTCIFLLLCASLYLDLRNFLENTVRDAQTRRSHQLANAILVHVQQVGEAETIRQIKEWYAPERNDRFIRLSRADGSLVYRSAPPHGREF
jgi:hypothetical protein